MKANNFQVTRYVVLAIGSAIGLYGQTKLTAGVPVAFLLPTNTGAILNGSIGYVLPIPSDPISLTVNVQIIPVTAAVGVYLRCGTDVGGANTGVAVFDTQGETDNNGQATLFLARPTGGTAGNCYIAMKVFQEPGPVPGIGGRLTATIRPFPAGTQVTISSLSSAIQASATWASFCSGWQRAMSSESPARSYSPPDE